MRGGALPPALLLAALALALALARPRVRIGCLVVLAVALLTLSRLELPHGWLDFAFLGCWASTVMNAAAVHLPGGVGWRGGLFLSVNSGLWTIAVVQLAGTSSDLPKACLALSVLLPARWLVVRRASIAVKVGSSWLIAIAILCGALPFLPVTPGYLPDHLE